MGARGQLSEPRVGTDGERVWLVRAAGRRDPPVIDLRPAEYEGLRQRAQMEAITALFERMTSPEELSGRYGLRFPGRVDSDADEPGT